jgi:hypothetical protein
MYTVSCMKDSHGQLAGTVPNFLLGHIECSFFFLDELQGYDVFGQGTFT